MLVRLLLPTLGITLLAGGLAVHVPEVHALGGSFCTPMGTSPSTMECERSGECAANACPKDGWAGQDGFGNYKYCSCGEGNEDPCCHLILRTDGPNMLDAKGLCPGMICQTSGVCDLVGLQAACQ